MNLEKNGESGLKTVRSFLGKMGTRQWVILLLLGLLLTVIALPVSDKKGEKSSGKAKAPGFLQILLLTMQRYKELHWKKSWRTFCQRLRVWGKCA